MKVNRAVKHVIQNGVAKHGGVVFRGGSGTHVVLQIVNFRISKD